MSLLKRHSTRKSSLLKKSRSKSQDEEYTVHDLSSLRRQRTIAYKRMCKALEVGLSAVNDSSQRDMFFSYHQDMKKIASNFENAHFAILEILDDPENDDSDMQESFDEMYYKVGSIFRSFTKNESCLSQSQGSSVSNVRLPKIQLPTFDGEIKRFPEYFDTFNALIHNSTSLSDTEKFHYLISSLSGDALTVVKTFPLSSEYYGDAYAALIARYKCKRELAFTCWREILNMNFNFKDAHKFRKSLDLFEENLCILKSVNLPVAHWDFVLVYHILSKLDTTIRRDFEEKYSNTELPSYAQLKEFLHSKCEALLRDTHFTEQAKQTKSPQKVSSQSTHSKRVPTSHALIAADETPAEVSRSTTATRPITCSFCNGSHSISSCPEFLEKSIDERMKIATDRNWCFNCLKSSHQLRNCTSIFSCRTCKRKHHTMLHRHTSTEPSETVSALVSRSQSNTTVLLATAIVQVRDSSGSLQSFRALFDTGSQSNFITELAVNRLKLKCSPTTARVSGLGAAATSILGDVTCSIGTNDRTLFEIDLCVLSKICGDQPIANLNTSGWSHITELPLADPSFDIPGPIDLLLAADVVAESLLDEHINGGVNQPTAFKSIFGWLLLGKTGLASTTLSKPSKTDTESNSLMQRLWDLDSVPEAQLLTPDKSFCEQECISDQPRDNSGRLMLRLPFENDSEPKFVRPREVDFRRSHAIECGLSCNSVLSSQCADYMSDYLKTGPTSLVPSNNIETEKYYNPYQCIFHPEFATTRLRVVFNASDNDFSSLSLNGMQLISIKLHPSIVEILSRFREHTIVSVVDVRQIYRQISISPDHCDYQRIFWRALPHEALQEYCLNTVTHGGASFPFLVCRSLQQLAENCLIDFVSRNDLKPAILRVLELRSRSHQAFNVFVLEIKSFDQTCTKRSILSNHVRSYELHGFAENSEIAYGSAIYLHVTDADGQVQVFSVCSGTRVAPLKRSSLPRLKLCAAVLLPDIHLFVRDMYLIRISFNAIYFWSNSSWIRSPSTTTATVVTNRISHVQDITSTERWHYILSGNNPADIVCSRGQFQSEVLHNPLWWAGPRWLSKDKDTWPGNQEAISSEEEIIVKAETRKAAALVTESVQYHETREAGAMDSLLDRYSSSHKMITVLTYINRFINNSRNPIHAIRYNFLNNVKRHKTVTQIVNHVQSRTFAKEILTLEPITAVSDEDLSNINQNRLSRGQLLQAFHQNFWSRWKHEYLNSLTHRAKWTKDSKPLQIWSMVIIKDENRAPSHRPLGRVIKLIAGADGVTRIAVLRTATSNQITALGQTVPSTNRGLSYFRHFFL